MNRIGFDDYLNFKRCPNLILNQSVIESYYQNHDPQLLALKKLYLQNFYPDLAIPEDFVTNSSFPEITREDIESHKIIFGKAIRYEFLHTSVDLLIPRGNAWELLSITSSTKIKSGHISHLKWQTYLCVLNDLEITACKIVYLNRNYTYQKEFKPRQFFKTSPVKVSRSFESLKGRIADMHDFQCKDKPATIPFGSKCSKPSNCQLRETCWKGLEPNHNIFELYGIGHEAKNLYEDEIEYIEDLPTDFPYSKAQKIQIRALKSGKTYFNERKVSQVIQKLEYPITYLDFEAFQLFNPLYPGTKPHQSIPYLFSVHKEMGPDQKPQEHHYIHTDIESDPRPAILQNIISSFPSSGSVVVFNKNLEIQILRELKTLHPEYRDIIEGIINRIVDISEIFTRFYFYHPGQNGKFSLKVIYPLITSKDYNHLKIDEGYFAHHLYINKYFYNSAKIEESDLVEYCKQDTLSLLEITRALREKL